MTVLRGMLLRLPIALSLHLLPPAQPAALLNMNAAYVSKLQVKKFSELSGHKLCHDSGFFFSPAWSQRSFTWVETLRIYLLNALSFSF